jgi:hypothetical protein
MQKINPLLNAAGKALKQVSKGSQTAAGQSKNSSAQAQGAAHADEPDRIDAINQLFAEFELAYHNQYYKAYSTEERLILAKKYWLGCLSEFSPRQIVAAGHKLVRSQEFLPTISAVIRGCEEGIALFGLPTPRDAYLEACRAPAPKADYPWSHQAVYLAGRAADWYFLASEAEEKSFPVFAHYYRDFCQRIIHGEDLAKPAAAALVNNPGRPLSNEEQQRRMALLREQLDL